MVLIRERGIGFPSSSPTTSLGYTLPMLEMAHSSNVLIHGSTINSAQGDLHIHNRDSESGMQHQVRSEEHSYR